MRIIVRPIMEPQDEIDVTERLVAVIAEELWRLYGGNEQLNWLEAERHLAQIVGEARAEAAGAEMARGAPVASVLQARESDRPREVAAHPAGPRGRRGASRGADGGVPTRARARRPRSPAVAAIGD